MQFLVLCVEQTSSAHQTSNICCLHNTFSCVATLSELNSSQKFGILQIVLSGGSIWQWSLVSVIETLLSNKEHQVLFAECHTTGDHFFICIFLPAHNLKPLFLLKPPPLLAFLGLHKVAGPKAFLCAFLPCCFWGSVVLCRGYLKGPGCYSDLGTNIHIDHHLKSITMPQRV